MSKLTAPVVLADIVHTDLHAAGLSNNSSLSFGGTGWSWKAHGFDMTKCCGKRYRFTARPILRFGKKPGSSDVVHLSSSLTS
jgi:hypothetical protein